MTEQSNSDDRRDDTKIERDHPQTRKAEPDARGASEWRDDVVPPEGEREERADEQGEKPVWDCGSQPVSQTGENRDGEEPVPKTDEQESLGGPVGELAEEAEAVRRQAVGAETGGNALGSSAGTDVGSGTKPDRGELGGGEPKAEEGTSTPAGTRSPGGEGRE